MASGINIEQGVPKFLPDLLKNDDEAQGCGWCKGKVPSTKQSIFLFLINNIPHMYEHHACILYIST